MSTKVTTGVVRASFVHVFEPQPGDEPGSKPKYSITLLIPKSDTATLEALYAAEKVAREAGKNTKFEGRIPNNLTTIIRDGDEDQDTDRYPEFAGNMFMNVRSDRKPVVVDQNVQEILDPTEVYSGCWVKASVNAFPFNFKGKKGVSFGLNAVQKVRDDEAFSGAKIDANEEFQPITDDGGVL
jgi:hypothetical protein